MEISSGIAKAINNFTSPEVLTTQFIKNVCLSDYTLDTVRGLLINPVKSKFIPKDQSCSYYDVMYSLYTLMNMVGYEKICTDIVGITDIKKIEEIKDRYKSDPEDTFLQIMYTTHDHVKGKNESIGKVISYKGACLYVEYVKDYKEFYYSLDIFFIGPKAKEVYNEYKAERERVVQWIDIESQSEDSRKILVMTMTNRGMWRTKSTTVPSTIIMDHVEGDIDEIIKMIDRSASITSEYGINKTIGILLHGPHGTGKSTIARYLAMVLKRTLILTTSDNLEDAMERIQMYTDQKFIMLIEDIDFMFTDRRGEIESGDDEDSENVKRSRKPSRGNDEMNKRTSLLFQILDGVLSNSNLMIIATTNYFDRLDPALIRDGRFDYKIELRGLDYDTARKVCEKFDVKPEDIDLSNWKLPIAPATLQTVLLKYKITNVNTYDASKVDDTSGEN